MELSPRRCSLEPVPGLQLPDGRDAHCRHRCACAECPVIGVTTLTQLHYNFIAPPGNSLDSAPYRVFSHVPPSKSIVPGPITV